MGQRARGPVPILNTAAFLLEHRRVFLDEPLPGPVLDLACGGGHNGVFLAREGFSDGVTVHRVIPDFVAQGGDPPGTGSGGPGYTLPAEFSDVPFERGTVGLARGTDPDSGGSQFFIAYTDQPDLNGQYTVFGKVVEGMKVVDSLTPRDPANIATPQPPGDTIVTIVIEEE